MPRKAPPIGCLPTAGPHYGSMWRGHPWLTIISSLHDCAMRRCHRWGPNACRYRDSPRGLGGGLYSPPDGRGRGGGMYRSRGALPLHCRCSAGVCALQLLACAFSKGKESSMNMQEALLHCADGHRFPAEPIGCASVALWCGRGVVPRRWIHPKTSGSTPRPDS